MRRADQHTARTAGFTLVEILLVMALMAVTAGLVTVNLIRPQTVASLSGIVSTLRADLRSQQIKAMVGDSGSATAAQAHGVYVQSNQYTLFKGSAYSISDTDNFVVSADPGITLSTSLPASQVVFSKASGEVSGFVNGSNTITLSNSSGQSTVVTISSYGVVTVN